MDKKLPGAKLPPRRLSGCSPTIEYGAVAVLLVVLVFRKLALSAQWAPYTVWIASWSIVTFLLYGIDKLHAHTRSGLRVPENLLHFLAIVGGALGAVLGIILFRHKVQYLRQNWSGTKAAFVVPLGRSSSQRRNHKSHGCYSTILALPPP
jgi:uncharacterized membrane protein YsdA (DUF1294 family)